LWNFKFGEERGDRPVRLRAALWRLRAACTAVETGLHPALPVSEEEEGLWILSVPECDPF